MRSTQVASKGVITTGSVHKSRTDSVVCMWGQLNRCCVVCVLIFQRGQYGEVCRYVGVDVMYVAPNDIAYTRWSCYSRLANLVQIVLPLPPPAMGARLPFFWESQSCGPAGLLVPLLIKAGDVHTNPGPTNTCKQVWICDICHTKIQVRKQISIRCNRIEHWMHLRCAGIRVAQYTDSWTCHQNRVTDSQQTQT